MNRLSKRFILCGLGILLVVGAVAGIAVSSGRSSAAGDTGTLAGASVESMLGRTNSQCGVGGAPAMKANRVSGPMGDLVAGPIVIGCGRRNRELIQLVAFRTTKQLCAEMERPSKDLIVGGACKPVNIAWQEYCAELCIASVLPADVGLHRRYKHSTLVGQASSELTNIKVVVHGSKAVRAIPAIEGRVESTLLEALHESEPFVVFGTFFWRCVPPEDVEVVATNKDHVVRRRGVMSLPHICVASRSSSPPKK